MNNYSCKYNLKICRCLLVNRLFWNFACEGPSKLGDHNYSQDPYQLSKTKLRVKTEIKIHLGKHFDH